VACIHTRHLPTTSLRVMLSCVPIQQPPSCITFRRLLPVWPLFLFLITCPLFHRSDVHTCRNACLRHLRRCVAEWRTFETVFAPAYQRMSGIAGGRPLGIGELGCSTLEGYSRAQWIREACRNMYFDFPRLEQV
jgi:hypothetical protein